MTAVRIKARSTANPKHKPIASGFAPCGWHISQAKFVIDVTADGPLCGKTLNVRQLIAKDKGRPVKRVPAKAG